jgi:hypothetical protein
MPADAMAFTTGVAPSETHGLHVPFWQNWFAPQTTPHMPQLFLSIFVLTQVPLHEVKPWRHWQVPPLQVPPTPHVLLHAPQWSGLVCVSTHTPLQNVCPPAHVQTPAWHVELPPQMLLHAPQCVLLVCVSTHMPLHNV